MEDALKPKKYIMPYKIEKGKRPQKN
jgi:hypothetical protein